MHRHITLALLMLVVGPSDARCELRADEDAHEVKIPLKDNLTQDLDLPQPVKSFLGIEAAGETVRMEFLDTTGRASPDAEWIVRRRAKQKGAGHEHELTIKRRFKSADRSFQVAVARATGAMASIQGVLEHQGEWSPRGLTLSVSVKASVPRTGADLGDDLEFRKIAGETVRARIGASFPAVNLDKARVFGPVDGLKYKGKLEGIGKITVEVFRVCKQRGPGFDYLTEVSVKADSEQEARTKLQQLSTRLQTQGWPDPRGEAKTRTIIERYAN